MKSLLIFPIALICGLVVSYVTTAATLGEEQPAAPSTKSGRESSSPNSQSKTSADNRIPLRPSDSAAQESPEAKAVLDQARQRLKSYQSIQAKIVETVSLGSQRFTVHGAYSQTRGSDLKLRLEYRVKLGDTEGSVLEVCDGKVLWTRHNIGGETSITRRDVDKIQQAVAGNELSENRILLELGFGGLPSLMAAIEKSIRFDQIRQDTHDGRKWTVIEGGWKADLLKIWQGNNSNAKLPDYVPARARLYFDTETFFPRRILYLSRDAEQSLRPMVSLDFKDVQIDAPLADALFKFVPPEGVFPQDLTEQFLNQIKRRPSGNLSGGKTTP